MIRTKQTTRKSTGGSSLGGRQHFTRFRDDVRVHLAAPFQGPHGRCKARHSPVARRLSRAEDRGRTEVVMNLSQLSVQITLRASPTEEAPALPTEIGRERVAIADGVGCAACFSGLIVP
jgi:hypothetical protein